MAEEKSESKKSDLAKREEEILQFWQENKIFEQSLEKPAGDEPKGEFVFYDGPPFATGTPHYGHILASAIKDAVPRYKTMRGFRVRRRWGWDCHGLPIENIAEKDLNISGKKQIEEIGVKKFNEHARSKVLEYIHEWQRTVERMGRWVDFSGSYKTMDNSFMESVWWAIKQMSDKELLYEGTRVLPYCPRCETPIANSEIAMDNSYKDISDISVTVKFKLKNPEKIGLSGDVYILAWTTTPWTLPGNVALAIGPEIEYAAFKQTGQEGTFIIARDRAEKIFQGAVTNLDNHWQGKELVGLEYEPLFNYYQNKKLPDALGKMGAEEKGWQIYGADFVTTEDGTGVVHIAPVFGEDDMNLAKAEGLPLVWHVDGTGRFKPEVTGFAEQLVKPKSDGEKERMQADIDIIKYLQDHDLFFAKEKIVHSYPHCFRCETPLYYYAIPAWFINIQKVKADILNLNQQKINWIPEHLKMGRFNNSVESAPDWNISRNRYWATPLPIWKCGQCQQAKIISSVDELIKNQKSSGNKYWVMRHGEAERNVGDFISDNPTEENHLTDKGRAKVEETAQKLKGEKIDLIISSDFVRTKETTKLVAEKLGLKDEQIIYDERLREVNTGDFTGQTWVEYNDALGEPAKRWQTRLSTGGENYADIRRRIMSLFYDLNEHHQNKNILIISHGLPLYLLEQKTNFATGEARTFDFNPLPHNDDFELDLHRPYIDEVKLTCACGGEMARIVEVVDCWLESGSMPFAANHYPFANLEIFDPSKKLGFPAQFIAEYIAQTRTWFYYMLVVSTILFKETSFENVVTTGTILAEDGQKMSKSKGNYPDPWFVFDKYGVDALRLYLLSSSLMKAEDLNFSEKGVMDIGRRMIGRLLNVLSFYQMYVTNGNVAEERPRAQSRTHLDNVTNILDQWILARLGETIKQTTEAFEKYEIDRSVWPLDDFIDDLSTWYLRRSRDRFKEEGADRDEAITTIRFVLIIIAKLLAPVAPFAAEMIYQALKDNNDPASVHLTSWPDFTFAGDEAVLEEMKKVREIVSLGLELRQVAKIKVRQPLAELIIKENNLASKEDLLGLIKDELNVKAVNFRSDLTEALKLDLNITPELQVEGEVRELIRQVQDERKKAGLAPGEKIKLSLAGDLAKWQKFETEIKTATSAETIDHLTGGEGEIKITKL